jgi:NADPH:quinone reductase-like Zn-dependent oxidoreductase
MRHAQVHARKWAHVVGQRPDRLLFAVDTVLIVGATGGLGSLAVQLAARPRENLQRLAGLLANGTLRVHIQATYDLAPAPDALTALPTTHTQGKLAIRIP